MIDESMIKSRDILTSSWAKSLWHTIVVTFGICAIIIVIATISVLVGNIAVDTEKIEKIALIETLGEEPTCYAYLIDEKNGLVGQYLGECKGYGMPVCREQNYSGQISRQIPPIKREELRFEEIVPEISYASWLYMVDKKTGGVKPMYVGTRIIVSPFCLQQEELDDDMLQNDDDGIDCESSP